MKIRYLASVSACVSLFLTPCDRADAREGASTSPPKTRDCYMEQPISPVHQVGDVLCTEPLHPGSEAALPSAEINYLIQYVSEDLHGKKVPITGTLSLPSGQQRAPIISWAHGTTGVARHCAPSLNGPEYSERLYVSLMNETLDRWVANGYAVLQSDYQGLGLEPGRTGEHRLHPYLIGESEAKNVIDFVRAAQRFTGNNLADKWLVMGHSQGGQATVYTAELAKTYAPELDLVAAVSIAPAAYLSDQTLSALENRQQPVSAFGALMMKGAEIVDPAVDLGPLLSDKGRDRYALVEQRCVSGLRQPDGWYGPLDELISAPTAEFDPLVEAMVKYQDTQLREPNVPLLVVQAEGDQATLPELTKLMVRKFEQEGRQVRLHLLTDLEDEEPYNIHQLTVRYSFDQVYDWVSKCFGGGCPLPKDATQPKAKK